MRGAAGRHPFNMSPSPPHASRLRFIRSLSSVISRFIVDTTFDDLLRRRLLLPTSATLRLSYFLLLLSSSTIVAYHLNVPRRHHKVGSTQCRQPSTRLLLRRILRQLPATARRRHLTRPNPAQLMTRLVSLVVLREAARTMFRMTSRYVDYFPSLQGNMDNPQGSRLTTFPRTVRRFSS